MERAMFKQNTKHLQTKMFGLLNTLPPVLQKEATASEEYCFYNIIFRNIPETLFEPLYSDKKSRPNAPINTMLAALMLQTRNQWTYDALFKEMKFSILTKIALGLDDLDTIPFCPATLFNFQNRINEHFVRTGENLFEQVFDGLTEKQLHTLKIKTNIQRTDSMQAASNIRNYSRLQLLIEVLIRLYRVLSEEDQAKFTDQFAAYVKRTSGQYMYALKASDLPHEFEKIGQLYDWITKNLITAYGSCDIFATVLRVYSEHFATIDNAVTLRPSDQLRSDMVQSPDDLDATYRNKNGKTSKGQVINVVETAHRENPINLITDVSVHANNTNDSEILNQRLDHLKEKTPDLAELHFDGGYGSEDNDDKMETLHITAVQTAIKGVEPAVEINIEKNDDSCYQVSCPMQTVASVVGRKKHKAVFDSSVCATCPLQDQCPAAIRKEGRVLYFTRNDYRRKRRHKMIKQIPVERRSLRNNVEATVHEFTYRMPQKKLKVRGAFKATMFAYSAATIINFGRIFRYLVENPDKLRSFFVFVINFFKKQFSRVHKFGYATPDAIFRAVPYAF
jgi:hypothetical protein